MIQFIELPVVIRPIIRKVGDKSPFHKKVRFRQDAIKAFEPVAYGREMCVTFIEGREYIIDLEAKKLEEVLKEEPK